MLYCVNNRNGTTLCVQFFPILHIDYIHNYCVYLWREYLKYRDLIKMLHKAGFRLERHGGDHDVYRRGNDIESVPRHKEINELLAKHIIRKWNL